MATLSRSLPSKTPTRWGSTNHNRARASGDFTCRNNKADVKREKFNNSTVPVVKDNAITQGGGLAKTHADREEENELVANLPRNRKGNQRQRFETCDASLGS